MAVTADVPYGGVTITGAKFTVKSAYHKSVVEDDASVTSFLSYAVEVELPDGTLQKGVGWDNVKGDADFTKDPLVDAEAHMKARLTAGGATNIEDV